MKVAWFTKAGKPTSDEKYSGANHELDAYPFSLTTFGTGNRNKTNIVRDIDTLIQSMNAIHLDTKQITGFCANVNTEEWSLIPPHTDKYAQ